MAVAARVDLERERLRRIGRKVRTRLAATDSVRPIVSDEAELWAVEGFFDPVECGRLIALIDEGARPSTTYEKDYSAAFRTSFTAELSSADPFVRGVQARIDTLLGIDGKCGEILQGQRYHPGQEFKPHLDWFPRTSIAWANEQAHGGQRSFTAMAYLNRVEAGGETDFPHLDIAVAPLAGTLLVWNNADADGEPNRNTLHAGNPVVRGVKYIVTQWYRLGPWV